MKKPLTLDEAGELLADKGIHTFSNGDHWDSWASDNCFRCRWYDPDAAGAGCAFEGAALLRMVSPAMALLFGWTESAKHPGSFREPEQCAFWTDRDERDGDSPPTPPPPDPAQLTFLAPDGWPEAAPVAEPAPVEVFA